MPERKMRIRTSSSPGSDEKKKSLPAIGVPYDTPMAGICVWLLGAFLRTEAHTDNPKRGRIPMRQAWMAGVAWVLMLFGGAWLLAPGISAAQPGKTDRPTGQTEKADGQDSRSVLQVYDGERNRGDDHGGIPAGGGAG